MTQTPNEETGLRTAIARRAPARADAGHRDRPGRHVTQPRRGSSRRPQLRLNVAPGIHQLEHGFVNCYLLVDGTDITVIDTGLPSTWPHLLAAVEGIARHPRDIHAIVLTHAHFDHLGFARRAQKEFGTPVWLHPDDDYIARHPYRYAHERPRLEYPVRFPEARPVLASMTRAGALWVRGVANTMALPATGALDVPGHPSVVFTPGHTFGHCALHLAEQDAVLTGDALVTLDPYTGQRGPQIVAGAATADSARALRSLQALEQTGAALVLPGHGDPFNAGIREAVERAAAVGAK